MVQFVCIRYLGGATFHVLLVPFGHLTAHVVDVVAVAVVGVRGAVLFGFEATGVHKRRVQRIHQVMLRCEPRPERRRFGVLWVFVEDHPRQQRPGAPGPVR